MKMAFSSVVVYFFTIVAVCLADDPPSSCNHGEYIRFANCRGYFHCVGGILLATPCQAGFVFSNKLKVCVLLSSDLNDCQGKWVGVLLEYLNNPFMPEFLKEILLSLILELSIVADTGVGGDVVQKSKSNSNNKLC